MLITYLQKIPDHRRLQSKQYDIAHLLLFVILGILSGCSSYRELESFMVVRFEELKRIFKIKWKKVPDYSTIRNMILDVDKKQLEAQLRIYAQDISKDFDGIKPVSIDGKTMRGSYDHFNDKNMVQILSVYLGGKQIILGHREVENDKTNEIPEAQKLITELGLEGVVYTLDALHCQKKQWT